MVRSDLDIDTVSICLQPGSEDDPLHESLPIYGANVLESAPVDIDHVEDWIFRDKTLRNPKGEILAHVISPLAAQVAASTVARSFRGTAA